MDKGDAGIWEMACAMDSGLRRNDGGNGMDKGDAGDLEVRNDACGAGGQNAPMPGVTTRML